jgi:hypothetical protein
VRKRIELTLHERQMRFFTVLFVVLIIAVFAAVLWLINRLPGTAP